MRTLKVVVIGDSGVGKTSLRGQYVSGRFSTSYRATIGADFISKTLPHHAHPTDPSEQVTLQIWDTAGQERFSSLSAAFFRGADAAVLMFDVSRPETLHSLRKWWDEFRERAPVPDDDGGAFCAVFVGNKVDVVPEGERMAVGRDEARAFVDELVPRAEDAEDGDGDEQEPERPLSLAVSTYEDAEDFTSDPEPESDTPYAAPSSSSIQIRAKRRSLLGTNTNTGTNAGNASTLSSVRTGRTAFYTPSSSVFTAATTAPSQSFESARSSFSPSPARKRSSSARRTSLSPPPDSTSRRSRPSSPSLSPRRKPSLSSLSTAATITPSLFTRAHDNGHTTPPTPPLLSSSSSPSSPSFPPPPPPLETGAALFFASAKSGEGVKDVFEYVARRVVRRWEAEEASEARTMHVFEGSVGDGIVRLREEGKGRGRELWRRGTCCAV